MKKIPVLLTLLFLSVSLFAQKNIKGRYIYKVTGEFIKPYIDTLILKKDGTFYRGRYSGLGTRRHLSDHGTYTFSNDSTLLLSSDPNPLRIDFATEGEEHREIRLADSDSITFEFITPDIYALPYLQVTVEAEEGREKTYHPGADGRVRIAEKNIKSFRISLSCDPARRLSLVYEPEYAVSKHVLTLNFERNIGLIKDQAAVVRKNSLVLYRENTDFKPEFVKQ
ncbi:MAG: hypothetical protein IBJ09_01565 [Bacteroidia bacterium]|nr:hypothetical protein [Bacteroidia bacterium]